MFLKRWKLVRYSRVTSRSLRAHPQRTFWTRTQAFIERDRLNRSLEAAQIPHRVAVERR